MSLGGETPAKPRFRRHPLQLAASFASAVIMLLVGVAGVLSFERVSDSEQWVEHAQSVQDQLAQVRANMAKADANARLFVATGDTDTLATFRQAANEIRRASTSLRAMVAEGTLERLAANDVDKHMLEALRLLEELVSSRASGVSRSSDVHVAERTAELTAMFEAVSELRKVEEVQLRQERAELRRHLRALEWVIVVGTGFAVLFAMATALRLRRTFIERAAAESDLSLRASELERALEQKAEALRDLRRGEREREQLIDQLERSNRELDQFAYVTSHDLKAPLRGIANLAGWVQEDLTQSELPDETRRHLDLMQQRVHRMEDLIEAILQYSRAGRANSKPENVDCGELVRQTVDLIAIADNVQLRLADDFPTVVTHRTILQQALLNLLTNAVKFADAEQPSVELSWRDDGDFIKFIVSDNGIGIDPESQSKIFKIFQTLGREEGLEGTGIGLAVVKKTAEVVGGSVLVVSTPGEGATFALRWPKAVKK